MKISEDAMPIVKSGIKIEENIIRFSLNTYRRELHSFEKKYKMKTKDFVKKFESGKLDDKPEWFDWLFAYKAYLHVKKRLEAFKGISI